MMSNYKNSGTKKVVITKCISVTPKAVHVVLQSGSSAWFPKSHIVGKVLRNVTLKKWAEDRWDSNFKWTLVKSSNGDSYIIPLGIIFSNTGVGIERATVEITDWLYKTKKISTRDLYSTDEDVEEFEDHEI